MTPEKEKWPPQETPVHRPHKPHRVIETRPGTIHTPTESEEEIRRRRENPDWYKEQR